MPISKLILAVAAATLLFTGCARQKNEATEAVTKIETSLAAMKEDGERYAPIAYQGAESTLAMLKDSMKQEEYKTVLAGTPQLQKSVDSLKEAIASGKEQFSAATAEWNTLNEEVPKMVESIQSRVDTLSKSRKLPKNVTKDAFESAKSGLETMKTEWNDATTAFSEGKAPEARDKGQMVKAKGHEVMTSLGMNQA